MHTRLVIHIRVVQLMLHPQLVIPAAEPPTMATMVMKVASFSLVMVVLMVVIMVVVMVAVVVVVMVAVVVVVMVVVVVVLVAVALEVVLHWDSAAIELDLLRLGSKVAMAHARRTKQQVTLVKGECKAEQEPATVTMGPMAATELVPLIKCWERSIEMWSYNAIQLLSI